MSSSTANDEQGISQIYFTEGEQMNVSNPVILLVGKTGAGKSTLGNLLLNKPYDEGPFIVSEDMESVTKECGTATMSIDGVLYDIVDTPGIFDTQRVTDEILEEIAKAVQKCAYGVKAILFVFEAKRFTEEQKNVLGGIRRFLGEDATNYIIAVFSHASKKQISDRNALRKAWNDPVRSFILDIDNRWGISPNSDYFPSEDPIHRARLGEIKALISGMRGVYTTEQLEKSRQEQEEARRQKEEEERKIKREYEENIKECARKESDEEHKRRIEEIEQEHKARREREETLRKQAEEQFKKDIESLQQEQKIQQEKSEEMYNKKVQEQKEAEERFRKEFEKMQQEHRKSEEIYNKRIQEEEQKRKKEEELRLQEQKKAEEAFKKKMEEAQKEYDKRSKDESMRILAELQERENRMNQETLKLIEEIRKRGDETERRLREIESKTDCFSLDTKVQLVSGKFVEMAELQVGDRICSNVRNGELEFSEVYLISHLGHYDYFLKMVKIEFTDSNGQKGQIRMTPTHCIFREDLSILYAQDVVPGGTKILVLNETNELVPVMVDNLIIEKDTGYVSFYTRAGTVVANNVLCSCYDDCPPSQTLMDLAFAPIRLWTKVFPSTHRQKELHPYVKILEIAYLDWCNTSNFILLIMLILTLAIF